MEAREKAELRKAMQSYAAAKNRLRQQITFYREQAEKGVISNWKRDQLIDMEYDILVSSPERSVFVDHATRASTDQEFEKHFRAEHSEAFFGQILDPEKL